MKTPIKLILAVVAVVVCCAAISSVNKPAPLYNPEQIKGNVRVVLLRVDRTTVFTDVGLQEIKSQKIHAIPGLAVIYAVELLGDEPVKQWLAISDGKLVDLNGKSIADSMPENLSGGGNESSFEYEHYDWGALKKPAVTAPKRTHVIEVWERGIRVPTGKIDLRITTGFNNHKENFVFENVPVE